MFEIIYHIDESSNVQHVGFISNDCRYDFSIIYTNHFFGKTIINCIQTGLSVLADNSELMDPTFLLNSFKLKSIEEASTISSFLQSQIPGLASFEQY